MTNVVVVGAGSAGCVAAARLSERPDLAVTLLEAGPDLAGTPDGRRLRSVSWLDALAADSAFDPVLTAVRSDGAPAGPYLRGRCIGGSGAVNAMLALPGLPSDFDRWAVDHRLEDWSWSAVAPEYERLRPDIVASDHATPVDLALLDGAAELGLPHDVDTLTPDDGAGFLYRSATATGRHSSREAYLDPAVGRPNLVVRPDTKVDRILFDAAAARGVVLTDGTVLEADEVVLCAGTIETPAILLRSGLDRPGIGANLQDHPAASILLRLVPEARHVLMDRPCINTVLRASSTDGTGDLHVLPMHGAVTPTTTPHDGVLMAAVMRVTSTGTVRLDPADPLAPPRVELGMLRTSHDRGAMHQAVGLARELLTTAAFRAVVESAFLDDSGTPVEALDDPAGYDQWLNGALGDYFHAVGTARMGASSDPMAVVDQCGRVHGTGGLRVVDASIFPTVPSANTHLPVVMAAERLSRALADDLTRQSVSS